MLPFIWDNCDCTWNISGIIIFLQLSNQTSVIVIQTLTSFIATDQLTSNESLSVHAVIHLILIACHVSASQIPCYTFTVCMHKIGLLLKQECRPWLRMTKHDKWPPEEFCWTFFFIYVIQHLNAYKRQKLMFSSFNLLCYQIMDVILLNLN